ncbi:MAG TPA: LuxR C-terminal-related transcriptional regulator [Methylophilaceae bacterium]
MSEMIICNELLANLYQSAITVTPQLFQQTVLEHLDRVIGFDRAWWGIMSREEAGFELHSSYRYELPAEFEEHWQAIKEDDSLAHDAHTQPRTTIHFNEKGLHSTPGLAELNTGHDLRHALCTSVFLADRKSFLFISLFRSGTNARSFTPEEIKLKQLLTPHLYSCWRTNLLSEIERTRGSNKTSDSASAFVDRQGMIVYADSSFGEMLVKEWPSWKGRRLPDQLLAMMEVAQTPASKRYPNLYIEQHQAGGLSRLDIRLPAPMDRLSNREREVARGFAKAHSYKEIALETNLSPATVRHYLRIIYEKLGINDKAELVRIVDRYDSYISADKLLATSAKSNTARDFDFLGEVAF